VTGPGVSEADKLAFLREIGTGEIRHIRVPLYEHLVATRDLLAGWGAEPALCDAALFHSVYGTEELDPRLDRPPVAAGERDRVRALIGAPAERRVWLFANIDRTRFVDWLADGGRGAPPLRRGRAPETLSASERRDLANLIVANALEQLPRRHRRHRRRTRELIRLRSELLPGALDALRRERRPWQRVRRRWERSRTRRDAAPASSPRA
jgi:hypothetical protein